MINSVNNIEILDCTLRDGGYYTNWDFSDELVELYLDSINALPINYIEIGYRSIPKKEYAGAYFYLPENLIQSIKSKTNKPLVIILDEKNVTEDSLSSLLDPCIGKIDIVRLAVSPENIERATSLIIKIKEFGFKVSLNLMYASSWTSELFDKLRAADLNEKLDYFYVVDSYGGLYPDDIQRIFAKLKYIFEIPLGFHGHNNLELAAINSLTAVRSGASVIDATITGMGRGAGNLKTELLLSILNKKNELPVDFDLLEEVVKSFSTLKLKYKWETNLAYMVSGVYSLPQSTVISQLNKRYYSLNTIIENSRTGNSTLNKKATIKLFKPRFEAESILIIGGGNTPVKYEKALVQFLKLRPEIGIIYVSSKNVSVFYDLPNIQIHCLPGKEMKRLEREVTLKSTRNRYFIYPDQTPPLKGSFPKFQEAIFCLPGHSVFKDFSDSATGMAFELCDILSGKYIYIAGFDGYYEEATKEQKELTEENQLIFELAILNNFKVKSLTPSRYNIPIESIYSLI